ncbi:MAG: glycosyltransferase family 2 protein [Conexivisphaerales archaeon]
MDWPEVSIIVPCKIVDDKTRECIDCLKRLDYPKFEIILLPDNEETMAGIRCISTGPVTPGKKRNVGAANAEGSVFAYIDSDAYPSADWLKNGVKHLYEESVSIVTGPASTPQGDSRFSQAQGEVLSSPVVGGSLSARYSPNVFTREVDDAHSVNLIARRNVIEQIGGWDEKYWPGEDTILCLKARRAGHKILFSSDVLVYHHRRATLTGYLKQIWNYGMHRGFFAKRYPENSRHLTYFVPSIFVIWLVIGLFISILSYYFRVLYIASLILYFMLDVFVALHNFRNALIVLALIPLTHMAYGAGFIRGIINRELNK